MGVDNLKAHFIKHTGAFIVIFDEFERVVQSTVYITEGSEKRDHVRQVLCMFQGQIAATSFTLLVFRSGPMIVDDIGNLYQNQSLGQCHGH